MNDAGFFFSHWERNGLMEKPSLVGEAHAGKWIYQKDFIGGI